MSNEQITFEPKELGSTEAGRILVGDPVLCRVGEGKVPNCDCFEVNQEGYLQLMYQDAQIVSWDQVSSEVKATLEALGATLPVAIQMTTGLGSPNSAGVFEVGMEVTVDYRYPGPNGAVEIAPRQTVKVKGEEEGGGGEVPVPPPNYASTVPVEYPQLRVGVMLLEGGGKIVSLGVSEYGVADKAGKVWLQAQDYRTADQQAVGLGPSNPGAQYWFDQVSATRDPEVIGGGED